VCPSACGRRIAIRALNEGEKNTVSFLYITEADLASGHYEDMIGDAIGELLAALEQTPKAFIIIFKCIDDLLGTDDQALVKRLSNQYPFLHFSVCHVHPIALDEKIKPGMLHQNQIYGLLEYTGIKDNSVNLIGDSMVIDVKSELFSVLSDWGVHQVRQIAGFKTFAEFLQMSDSRLNLVMIPMGELAAQNMVKKLDIPYLMNPISYDIQEITQTYHNIADMLGTRNFSFEKEIESTREAIQKAQEYVRDMPIVVDSSATMRPFSMAKALCRYGFNVKSVFYELMLDSDWEDCEWLESNFPQVSIVRSQNYELIMDADLGRECIAIGFNSGYILQANHFVDMLHDESFYGFHGVRKLMQLICAAHDITTDWEKIKETDKEPRQP
jgi:nitrogenase molybdenum-iron protein alpha/beta subunit